MLDAARGTARPVALVTGAARRVGRALALALGERGFDIAVHYHASRREADETVAALGALGAGARLFDADLTSPSEPADLVRRVVSDLKRLDLVVNSAAVMLRTPFGEVTPETWDAILNLNLRAPFLIAQEAARHLPDGGNIVNIADLSAFETWPGYLPHAVSKAGVVHMTRVLARLLAPRLRVNAVAPGTVLLPEGWDAASAEKLRRQTPLERWGSPGDVAQAVLYLIGAPYVTGETLIVDGGRHVR
jgi:pteridine reductase